MKGPNEKGAVASGASSEICLNSRGPEDKSARTVTQQPAWIVQAEQAARALTPGELAKRRQFAAAFTRDSFRGRDWGSGDFSDSTQGEIALRRDEAEARLREVQAETLAKRRRASKRLFGAAS